MYCCCCKQKTAYERRISDRSSDVCSSDLVGRRGLEPMREAFAHLAANRGAYDNLQSLAEMAIIYSRYSQDNIDGIGSEVAYIDYFRGAHNALLDQRIPFAVLSDKRVTTKSSEESRERKEG